MNDIMLNLIIGTVIYIFTSLAIIYITHEHDAHHLTKPILFAYNILGLFFFSVIKFLLLSLGTLLVTAVIIILFT